MMKTALALALLLTAGSAIPKAIQTAEEDGADIVLSPRAAALCAREGGCTLYTKVGYDSRLEAAEFEAFKSGFEAGLAEGLKRRAL